MPRWELEFYEDESGREPVHDWIFKDLEPRKRRALVAALEQILQEQGINVCGTPFGDNIGDGIFEFRLRLSEQEIRDRYGGPELEDDERVDAQGGILLRVFCHAYGQKIVLLVSGYDKGKDASSRRQQQEIKLAKKRLAEWQRRQRRAGTGRTGPPTRLARRVTQETLRRMRRGVRQEDS